MYRLAKAPAFQQALREEIQLAGANGGDKIEYDHMPLLNALINVLSLQRSLKARLKFYAGDSPVVPRPPLRRTRCRTRLCPSTSRPITTTTGIQITEIPIQKGQAMYVAIASYNRYLAVYFREVLR